METMMTVKGQVVIPAKIRNRLKIKKGTRFHVEERDGEIVIRPLNRAYFEKFAGMLKGSGIVESHMKAKAEEIALEEAKFERVKGSR
jgi:AbrB family looped-hinge helix DNA binding protein